MVEEIIQSMVQRELQRRAAWIEFQIERALPAPVVWALRFTGWIWLARLTGVELHYHPESGEPYAVTIEVLQRGRVVARRRFEQPRLGGEQ